MRRAPRRPWRPSALLLALAMCDLAPTRYARPLPTDCARREGRLAAYPCSDESCRVFSAHYLGWILRKGEVLASRQVLQGTGVVDVDCPVCLGVLKAGEGVVTFHILECGHRCAAPFLFPGAPFRQRGACRRCQCPPLPTSPPPPPHALSRWVCYTGSTKTAGSRSKRGGPRPAPCAGARSVAARRAPRARLRSRATWPDAAPQLHLPAPVVAELEGRARAAPPMSISLGAIYSMPG